MTSDTSEPPNPGGAFIPLLGRYDRMSRARYEFANQLYSGGNYLDFGCGFGAGTSLVSRRVHGESLGIDVDARAVKYASTHFSTDRLRFVLGDSVTVPLPENSVGLVTCFEVIEHLYANQRDSVLRELRRVLTENGVLIGSTPIASTERTDLVFHTQEFTSSEVASMFEGIGFRVGLLSSSKDSERREAFPISLLVQVLPRHVKRWFILKIAQSLMASIRSPPVDAPLGREIEFSPSSGQEHGNLIFVCRRA